MNKKISQKQHWKPSKLNPICFPFQQTIPLKAFISSRVSLTSNVRCSFPYIMSFNIRWANWNSVRNFLEIRTVFFSVCNSSVYIFLSVFLILSQSSQVFRAPFMLKHFYANYVSLQENFVGFSSALIKFLCKLFNSRRN